MSRARIAVPPLLLWLVLLFPCSIPALSPLMSLPPTRSADGLLHLYRLVELEALWRNGILFARWLPDLAFGYGMPLFNYYAPLVYYLTTPLYSLGVPATLALNVSLAAALYVGAVGVFFFTRAVFSEIAREGEIGALVAAVAFLYSPYLLFNALERGNLAEEWALAFAPLAFWRLFVLSRTPNARNWVLVVICAVAVLLSHNVTGFLFTPFFVGFAFISGFSQAREGEWQKRAFALGTACIVALALSAFFWLPALVERDFVQIARVIVTPDFDYRFNFVPPLELIALLPRADTGRMNTMFPATLGVVQALLALIGIVVLLISPRVRRALPLFALAAAGFVFVALMLAVSQPLWDRVSLLSFVQLPMRLRGLVALCLAPLVGVPFFILCERWRLLGASITIVLLVLSALPMLYPLYARDVPLNPTLADMLSYEGRTGAIGTTSFGEYLPAGVRDVPDHSPLNDEYQRGVIPNRFVLPPGVTECGESLQRIAQTICVSSPMGWRAVFRAFYFPGWQVKIDNQVIQARATNGDGLLTFDVPSGEHTLSVNYSDTPVELLANWISIVSGVMVLGVGSIAFYERLCVRAIRSAETAVGRRDASSRMLPEQRVVRDDGLRSAVVVMFCALVLIAFKSLYVDRVSNLFVAHYAGTQVEGISQPRRVQFGDEMQLLGFDVNGRDFARGETVRVTLYWRALPALQRDLSAFVHLTASDGFVKAQKDNLHPANLPTTRWDVDAYAADTHAFEIPAALAPGEYELRAGVYDPSTSVRLKTPDGADYVFLEKIRVR